MSHSSSSSSSLRDARDVLGVALERAVLVDVRMQRRDVEAGRRVHAARDVGDGDDTRALVVQLGRGDPADVPEALHGAALCGEVPAEPLARALDHHHDACAGRLVPEERAADRHRLAGDDLRHGVTLLHRVRVHHPRHRLLVRRHVGRGDVELRPDERRELRGEAARDARDLGRGELARVAAHAALRAAVRQAEQRALPRHPHRERRALAEVDALVVADAALRRAEHRGVLHAVGRERAERAVVHLHGQRQDQRALGMAETGRDHRRDLGQLERMLELRARLLVERCVPLELGRGVCHLGHGGRVRHSRGPGGFKDGPHGPLRCSGRVPILSG